MYFRKRYFRKIINALIPKFSRIKTLNLKVGCATSSLAKKTAMVVPVNLSIMLKPAIAQGLDMRERNARIPFVRLTAGMGNANGQRHHLVCTVSVMMDGAAIIVRIRSTNVTKSVTMVESASSTPTLLR